MGYITAEGRERVKAYKYAGEDRSLLYKWLLSPWAQALVDRFTPIWVAPNVITLAGLCLQVLAAAVLYMYSGDFTTAPPAWTCVLAAACLFWYSTLDNMDGKQARRTQSSSALGLLFDHGCDAVNAGMVGPLILAMVCQTGPASWPMFAMWTCAAIPFFMNTWEEFHLQVFILPIINGPNEGIILICGLFLLTAALGSEIWAMPAISWATLNADTATWYHHLLAGHTSVFMPAVTVLRTIAQDPNTAPPTNMELMIATVATAMVITVVFNTLNVLWHVRERVGGSWWDVLKAIGRQAPTWALQIVCGMWLQTTATRNVAHAHPYLFFFTAGSLFVDYTSKLMVSHACDQKYRPFYGGLVLFAAAPIVELLQQNGLASFPEAWTADFTGWLWVAFIGSTTSMCIFAYEAVNELAAALDVEVFDITKQLRRAGKI